MNLNEVVLVPTMLEYLQWVAQYKQLSPHTLQAYERDLRQLVLLVEQIFGIQTSDSGQDADVGSDDLSSDDLSRSGMEHLGAHHILQCVMSLHQHKHHPRSIARYLSSWRAWYGWLLDRKKIMHNPVQGIRAPKAGQRLPKALSVEQAVYLTSQMGGQKQSTFGATQSKEHDLECTQALGIADENPTKQALDVLLVRDAAIVELLYSSGLRLSELVGLDEHPVVINDAAGNDTGTGWLDLLQSQVHVLGKGKKPRIVPVGSAAIRAVMLWLAVRAQIPHVHRTSALFVGRNGTRLTGRSVQLRLAQHAQRLGLSTDVHPHMLRHSFASHLLQSSGEIRSVQEMLGHANLSTTQIYTTLDFQHLAHVYDQAHPRAKKKSS